MRPRRQLVAHGVDDGALLRRSTERLTRRGGADEVRRSDRSARACSAATACDGEADKAALPPGASMVSPVKASTSSSRRDAGSSCASRAGMVASLHPSTRARSQRSMASGTPPTISPTPAGMPRWTSSPMAAASSGGSRTTSTSASSASTCCAVTTTVLRPDATRAGPTAAATANRRGARLRRRAARHRAASCSAPPRTARARAPCAASRSRRDNQTARSSQRDRRSCRRGPRAAAPAWAARSRRAAAPAPCANRMQRTSCAGGVAPAFEHGATARPLAGRQRAHQGRLADARPADDEHALTIQRRQPIEHRPTAATKAAATATARQPSDDHRTATRVAVPPPR